MTPGRTDSAVPPGVRTAFSDIIEGKTVKRSQHHLFWENIDCTDLFIDVLAEKGFLPCRVGDVDLAPGERIPAFCLLNGTAWFGWIFWEKFSDSYMRKLFGSIVRNSKGDWAVQVPEKKSTTVFANRVLMGEMDIDNPTGF